MNKNSFNLKGNLITALAIVSFVFISLASGEDKTTNEKTSSEQNNDEKTAKWTYSENTDKMEGTKQYFASITSTNKIDFEFPYEGGSTFDIIVRNKGVENEVLLIVSKGQFMTSISGDETLKVKFDDNKPENYIYNSASDASMDVVFIDNSKKFIDNLKKSKKLMIEANFYNAGKKVIEFNIEGFKWEK
jgi:hypothetical protein